MLVRHKPTFTYSGLTIILSNMSRFDVMKSNLLTANGGRLIDELLKPDINRYQCDIRLKEDLSPLLEGTKCIILLGETAAKLWCRDANLHIGQARGSIFEYDGAFTRQQIKIPMIPSFYPQDAVDIKDYEGLFNKQDDDNESEDSDDEEGNLKSRHGKTARRNYRFWLKTDIGKCKQILKGTLKPAFFKPVYHISPPSEKIIKILNEHENQDLFIDIETFIPNHDIQCLGFSFAREPDIYVFPWFDYRFERAYSNLVLILQALATAFSRNTTIAHNGSSYDFPVIVWKYHIPIGPLLKDTMIMQHRFYSDVEKSLGHFTSLWTNEPFHKDEGGGGWFNPQQMTEKMQYCGKDVFTMKLGYYNMLEHAEKIPGLLESMQQGNDAILPYMLTMLQGFPYSEQIRIDTIVENDELMMQYIRMLDILVGEATLKAIAGKSNSPMPGSNPQCVRYFHDLLGYPIVAKGKETSKGVRNPSLGKKSLLKLRLKHDNPVIDIVQAYREAAKETGSLQFHSWDFNNRNMPVDNDERQLSLANYVKQSTEITTPTNT